MNSFKEYYLTEDKSWIGIDLDGTLAHYTHFKGDTVIGKPILKIADRVRKWVEEGNKVKIFTARANKPKAVKAIKQWLKDNNLPALEVTNVKDQFMTQLWDDRAIQVQKNTGEIISNKEENIMEDWKSALAGGLFAASTLAGLPQDATAKEPLTRNKTVQTISSTGNYNTIMKNLNNYGYIAQRFNTQETLKDNLPVLEEVSKEYNLNPVQKKTLFSMRILENGRRGCEFGIDDYNLQSPSRRYAPERVDIDVSTPKGQAKWDKKYKNLSLKVQAQYAAGTIKKRLFIDKQGVPNLASLAKRYCPENWQNWHNLITKFMSQT